MGYRGGDGGQQREAQTRLAGDGWSEGALRRAMNSLSRGGGCGVERPCGRLGV